VWHILVLAQQLAASRESSPARRCCELFVCLSILLGGCHLHIALGRTENDAVPNHLPPPLQLIFRFNNNNNRPERDGPKHFPAQQSIRAYREKYSPGWLVYVVSCSSHSTKLRSLPKVSFPFGRSPPLCSCPSCPTLPQNTRNFFVPILFYFHHNVETRPDCVIDIGSIIERKRYFSMRVKVNRASW
jgi:hypothetical protein